LEDKNRKIAENEQSARANLIVVMLKGIFYTEKGIPMNSGPVEMGRQNRRTLGVRDCITWMYLAIQPIDRGIVQLGLKGIGSFTSS